MSLGGSPSLPLGRRPESLPWLNMDTVTMISFKSLLLDLMLVSDHSPVSMET